MCSLLVISIFFTILLEYKVLILDQCTPVHMDFAIVQEGMMLVNGSGQETLEDGLWEKPGHLQNAKRNLMPGRRQQLASEQENERGIN